MITWASQAGQFGNRPACRPPMAEEGHEAQLPSARYQFGQGTFTGTRGNERDAPNPDLYAAAGERASFELLPVIRLRRRDQQGSTHIPSGRSAS